ncbi:MAG TPA: hypothetical protein VFR07_13165, partial [Mycobacteriales bacterium]|nr:hypothetical protein [Mycobacteriales bacterium]
AALAGSGLLLVLLVAGLLWARSGVPPVAAAPPAALPQPAVPLATPVPSVAPVPEPAPDWAVVLAGLDGLRGQAFGGAGPGPLAEVYVPGSAALAADRAALAALTASGRTASGLAHQVRRVEQTSYGGDRARVRVVDVLGPQTVRDAAGAVVETLPGRGEASYDVELVRAPAGWRIAAVQRAPSEAGRAD